MEQPNTKVGAGALGGALALIVIWIVSGIANVEPPAEVGSAITIVTTFVTSYFVRERSSDGKDRI